MQSFSWNDKFFFREPTARINDYVPDVAGGVIEDHVINLAEFLVIAAI